jgi:hypothetical protein
VVRCACGFGTRGSQSLLQDQQAAGFKTKLNVPGTSSVSVLSMPSRDFPRRECSFSFAAPSEDALGVLSVFLKKPSMLYVQSEVKL